MHICMYVRLANAWTVGRNLLIFDSQEIILHTLVPGEYEHDSAKNGAFQMYWTTQNGDFY
jgi:hypothetical protein